MNKTVTISSWVVACALALSAANAAARPAGPPAFPLGETDIAIGAREASAVVPPGTLIRLVPPNDRPELHLSRIAFFVDADQRQTLPLLPSENIPNFEFRVPDQGPKKYRLSLMGMDDDRRQTAVQTVMVVVDPSAVCHGRVTPLNSMQATLNVIGEHITSAYVFADHQYIGQAVLMGAGPTLSLAKLPPGRTDLTIIAEDEFKNLYCPCKAPVDVEHRFKLSLSAPTVTVDQRGGSVVANVEPQGEAADKIAKIRFLIGTKPVGVVDGPSAKQTIPLADFGTGKYTLGVQGLTKDGELMGMEVVPLEVKNPEGDHRLASRSLQEKLTDDYTQLRQLDDQLDSTLLELVKTVQYNNWWGYNGYNWNSNYYGYNYSNWNGSAPTLNSFKDSRGYYTIPIIDSYTGTGYPGTLLTDARNLIMRRGQVQLDIAQILIQQKRTDRARQTLQDLKEETWGTWLERQANAVLRSLG